jgi:uncharacterized protein YdbL (DUF1318 family)
MNRKHVRWVFGMAAIMGIAACVTVNIYFPAAEVEKAAERIVDDVYGQDNEATPEENSDQSALKHFWAWMGPQKAWAQDATTVSNAAIRGLKQTIAGNHQELKSFYAQGAVGITKDGYLEVRDTSGLNLGQVAALRQLVQKDNEGRRQLYREVAAALQLDSSQVGKVEDIFARQWRDKASSGWWIQQDNGQWVKK